jgi:high-affinity iron transporter
MAGALIIVFREIIEAGLIIGIVLAATRNAAGSRLWIAGGVLAGVMGSAIVAVFTSAIASAFEGFGQELFNAAILAAAVVMLIWHNTWMASHGRAMADEMFATGRAVIEGRRPLFALAIVVGAAVLREGSEVVLFLYGVSVSGGESASNLLTGGLLGLGLGAAVSALTYFGLLRIPNRHLFRVTSWLIALLAVGMAAQSVFFLEQAGAVSMLSQTVWDSSAVLPEGSVTGRILHTLTGYSDRPTLLQLVAYLSTLVVIFGLSRLARGAAPAPRAAAAPTPAE